MKSPAGEIEAKSFGLKLDGVELSGRALKEIRVSNVHADGLRVSPTCTRSHRAFAVTDTEHLLHNEFHFKCSSNIITTLTPNITPFWLESKLLQVPVFFEEGSFLYNRLGLSIQPYLKFFTSPGLKVISFHPVNMAFNTPEIAWMRLIKDSLTREEFNHIDTGTIERKRNREKGAFDLVMEIINLTQKLNAPILTLEQIYTQTINPLTH